MTSSSINNIDPYSTKHCKLYVKNLKMNLQIFLENKIETLLQYFQSKKNYRKFHYWWLFSKILNNPHRVKLSEYIINKIGVYDVLPNKSRYVTRISCAHILLNGIWFRFNCESIADFWSKLDKYNIIIYNLDFY